MPEVVCNTSPLQYLYQVGLLHVLPALAGHITIPQAVAEELAAGRAAGVCLPDPTTLEWLSIRQPASAAALPLMTDLVKRDVVKRWQIVQSVLACPKAAPMPPGNHKGVDSADSPDYPA